MAGFFHYLPGVDEKPDDELDRLTIDRAGLADVLADCRQVPDQSVAVLLRAGGPDGGGGLWIYPKPSGGEVPDRLVYNDADFDVYEVAGGARWIAWLRDDPPGPADLQRRKTYLGYLVSDDRGAAWLVPIARSPDPNRPTIPSDVVFDAAGEPELVRKPQFEKLWSTASIIWDWLRDERLGDVAEMSPAWRQRAAVQALAVQYRLGPHEITALHRAGVSALDSEMVFGILTALVDQPFVEQYKKKQTITETTDTSDPGPPPGSSSPPGEPAAERATVPA